MSTCPMEMQCLDNAPTCPTCKAYSVRLDQEDGDYHQVLRIERNGVVIEEQQDGGEPEDQSFYRDWKWVPDALRKAYAFGLEDGRREVAPTSCEGKEGT